MLALLVCKLCIYPCFAPPLPCSVNNTPLRRGCSTELACPAVLGWAKYLHQPHELRAIFLN